MDSTQIITALNEMKELEKKINKMKGQLPESIKSSEIELIPLPKDIRNFHDVMADTARMNDISHSLDLINQYREYQKKLIKAMSNMGIDS